MLDANSAGDKTAGAKLTSAKLTGVRNAGVSIAAALDRAAIFLKQQTGWRRWLIAFLAGVCAALAMAPIYALPLLAVSFSALILLLDVSPSMPRPKRSAFAIGWFFGFGFFLAGVYWMAFSFFVQADEFAWMAPFAVSGMPAFLGLFAGAATLTASFFWKPGAARIFAFAAAWAVFEYLRGHILTGLPWNLVGQALAGSAIGAQTAAWYGAYGLSLVAVLIAASPAAGLGAEGGAGGKAKSILIGPLAMLVGVGALFVIGGVRLALPEPAPASQNFLRVVQPNIPQREKIDPSLWGRNFNRLLELSQGPAPKAGRLFIIWPENAAPLLDESKTALDVLTEQLPENAMLITGAVRRERNDDGAEKFFNSIMVVAQTPRGRRPIGFYDKHHLVPFGEFLPFYEVLDAVGLAQLTPYGDAGFSAGSGPKVMSAGGPAFAPLICYEVIFPGAMYPKGERPEWLVTVTNDAWFGDTSGPRQHLDQARLRSIETGLPMARSANTGISAVIDGKGRILSRLPLYKSGRIEAALPPALTRPLVDRVGDWLFWFMIAGCLAAAWKTSRRARSQ